MNLQQIVWSRRFSCFIHPASVLAAFFGAVALTAVFWYEERPAIVTCLPFIVFFAVYVTCAGLLIAHTILHAMKLHSQQNVGDEAAATELRAKVEKAREDAKKLLK